MTTWTVGVGGAEAIEVGASVRKPCAASADIWWRHDSDQRSLREAVEEEHRRDGGGALLGHTGGHTIHVGVPGPRVAGLLHGSVVGSLAAPPMRSYQIKSILINWKVGPMTSGSLVLVLHTNSCGEPCR